MVMVFFMMPSLELYSYVSWFQAEIKGLTNTYSTNLC